MNIRLVAGTVAFTGGLALATAGAMAQDSAKSHVPLQSKAAQFATVS